ncbi:MAG: hypothetical protein FJ290_19685 [Planctomycetes bacterium]|nr:hypothetical protein [Planctomycetota bacterium]
MAEQQKSLSSPSTKPRAPSSFSVVAIAATLVIVLALAGGALLLLAGRRPAVVLSREMRRDFGAAAWVPQGVSAYTSHLHLADTWKKVWRSNAVQSLVALPAVQDAWRQVQRHPGYRSFMGAVQSEPVLVEGLPVLEDAVSSEVFACAGSDLPGFLQAMGELLNTVQFAGVKNALRAGDAMREALREATERLEGPDGLRRPRPAREQRDQTAIELVDVVLANEKRLHVPSVLLGFKLTKPDAARRFLDAWVPQIGPTPFGTFRPQTIRGTSYHVFELHGETLFGLTIRSLPRDLARAGVPREKANRFVAWLTGLRLKLAVGVAGDYLLVSIGKGTDLLEGWGKGASLAEAPEFAPLRASYKPGLDSLSYTSAQLAGAFSPNADGTRRFARNIAAVIPERPGTKGLKERILKDAELLIKDIKFPVPSAAVACSFRNKGIESLSFGGPPAGGLNCSQPLTILAHRARQPILFAASRAAKSPPGSYDKAVKWIKVLFGYFRDYAVPAMDRETRRHYDTIMGFALPFLAEIDETNRTCLVPAFDGAQHLLVLDGNGVLVPPAEGARPPKPIPLPRLGLAIELADADKFTRGIERYAAAIRKLIDDARKAYPKLIPPTFDLPRPVVADTPAGKQVFYPLPWNLGQDVFPCALLKGRLLVLASSSNLAREMASPVPLPASSVTAPQKPAGAVSGADLLRAWDYLRRLSDALFALAAAERPLHPEDRQQMLEVRMHLDALWRALGALRSYSSTTTARDGRVVTHSWLHVEDIKQ